MRSEKTHTVAEIVDIYRDMKPKFIALKSPSGVYDIRYNQPKKGHVDAKFKEITERLKQKTLPSGIYVVAMKNDNLSTSNETEFPVIVGKNAQTIQVNKPMNDIGQNTLSTTEYMKTIAENTRLVIQLEFANGTIEAQKKYIQELEQELEKADTSPLAEGGNSWMKDLSETAQPLLEMFLDQRERALTIEEKKLGLSSPAKKESIAKRDDDGIVPGQPGYKKYFENILRSEDDKAIDHELDYLETNFPKLYEQVCQHYDLLEDETETETTETTEGE